jgi:ubiquinone/menaquinone biosynthesis C-methylase UbiE
MRNTAVKYDNILEDFKHNRSARVRRQVRNVLGLIALGEDEDICEVGVATGKFSCVMSRANRVFALDISEENLKRAKRTAAELGNIKNLFCVAGDCAAMPFYDAAFDKVVAIDIIEHLDDKTCGLFCKEAGRVLKRGGFLYIYTPNLLHPYELARPFRPVMRREHIGVRTRARICLFLREGGFIIEKACFNNLFRRISIKAVKA